MEISGSATTGITGNKKSAAHNDNFTINLEMENGQIRKVHPILIVSLNNCQAI
jgi:type VI protein secretion system component Hcp